MAGGQQPLAAVKWWNDSTVAVVTGANKGIGLEIARLLAEQGVHTIATARDPSLGAEALTKLRSTAGDKVEFHQLDITDAASVDAFAQWLKSTHGQLTILVNNAGFAYKGDVFGADEAQKTMDVNMHGTARVCESLKPLLSDNARIVNVCSRAGLLRIIGDAALRRRFETASSVDEVNTLAREFIAAIEDGSFESKGWPRSMYGMSKLCESTYTRVLAAELESKHIMVNACCPGWCVTDMSSQRGNKTAAEGADTPAWLALLPPDQFTTGGFFGERKDVGF